MDPEDWRLKESEPVVDDEDEDDDDDDDEDDEDEEDVEDEDDEARGPCKSSLSSCSLICEMDDLLERSTADGLQCFNMMAE